jgi:serine/threonine-protein kinase HipA
MTDKTLNVLLDGQPVGRLIQRPGGRHAFEYLKSWQENPDAIPLSYSIPLQQDRHGTRVVTDFMWGLLPDNEQTLRRWGARYKVPAHNPFALLAAIGEDCPGAVQIVPPDLNLKGRKRVTWLAKEELEDRIRKLKDDAGAGRLENDTGQFSLAGSQEKTALYRVGKRWGVPQGRTPTTHILKPETGRVREIAANEHFCLQLARQCRLPAAISEVEIISDIPVIIVERFDRYRASNGLVRRVHQEDMCQALATREKYQQRGGPGIFDIMALLQFSERPDVDRDRFMRAQAFNYLIAGTDAHARNYSISYARGGGFRLSPLYDVISDLPYTKRAGSKPSLAMTIGGKRMIKEITPRHWERQARSVRFAKDQMFGHLRDLIARLPEAAGAVQKQTSKQGLKSPVIGELTKAIETRCKFLVKYYGTEAARTAA